MLGARGEEVPIARTKALLSRHDICEKPGMKVLNGCYFRRITDPT